MSKIVIHVGPYKIWYYPAVPRGGKHNIWIQNESGEGMGVDLDQLWKEKF